MLSCFLNNHTQNELFPFFGLFVIFSYLIYVFSRYFRNTSTSSSLTNFIDSGNLNQRMKTYEYNTLYTFNLGVETPFIIRLNGRNFKNIKTKENYTYHLHVVGMELMKEFHAQSAMVYNNEINLVFYPIDNPHFNGICMKLQSVIASYAASSLSLKLHTLCSFHSNIVDFNNNNMDLLQYIKWRFYQAKSIGMVPYFIKRKLVVTDDIKSYKHIKFILNSTQVKDFNDSYFNLFTEPNLIGCNDIKLPKLYEMNEILENTNKNNFTKNKTD